MGILNWLGSLLGSGQAQPELACPSGLASSVSAPDDNPSKEVFVDDKRAYIRIHTEHEMVLHRQTIEEELGRPFKMNDLEVDLSSFAGQIESGDNSIRFYFTKKM